MMYGLKNYESKFTVVTLGENGYEKFSFNTLSDVNKFKEGKSVNDVLGNLVSMNGKFLSEVRREYDIIKAKQLLNNRINKNTFSGYIRLVNGDGYADNTINFSSYNNLNNILHEIINKHHRNKFITYDNHQIGGVVEVLEEYNI